MLGPGGMDTVSSRDGRSTDKLYVCILLKAGREWTGRENIVINLICTLYGVNKSPQCLKTIRLQKNDLLIENRWFIITPMNSAPILVPRGCMPFPVYNKGQGHMAIQSVDLHVINCLIWYILQVGRWVKELHLIYWVQEEQSWHGKLPWLGKVETVGTNVSAWVSVSLRLRPLQKNKHRMLYNQIT